MSLTGPSCDRVDRTPDPDASVSKVTVSDAFPSPKEDAPAAVPSKAEAVFAGGCFWCTEAVFEQLVGVSDVVSGYSGGNKATANYKAVCEGDTGHAEVIHITYDPSKITFGQLLRVFFATHDPTQLNRQGADVGTQYRSAVFYASEEEKHVTEAYIRQLNEAGVYPKPIVTTLEPLTAFYPAEDYHQDYATCNPFQPYIKYNAAPKVEKVRSKFSDLVKPQ